MSPVIIALGAILILVIFVLIVASRQSDEFRIARSIVITAPPAVIFSRVNDFHQWESFSPWEKLDPNLQRTFGGPPAGEGASYAWSGNAKVGAGRMTIIESRPSERLRIRLEFLKPFKATNIAEFSFRPDGPRTEVLWAMTGSSNLPHKLFRTLMNMDKLIGKDFEKGLASLKTVSEGE